MLTLTKIREKKKGPTFKINDAVPALSQNFKESFMIVECRVFSTNENKYNPERKADPYESGKIFADPEYTKRGTQINQKFTCSSLFW